MNLMAPRKPFTAHSTPLPATVGENLIAYLSKKHGVRVVLKGSEERSDGSHRRYDTNGKLLYLAQHLRPGQQAFQMATQLASPGNERCPRPFGSGRSFLQR